MFAGSNPSHKSKRIGKFSVYDIGHGKKNGSYPVIGEIEAFSAKNPDSIENLCKMLQKEFHNYDFMSNDVAVLDYGDIGVVFAIEHDGNLITKTILLANIVPINIDILPNGNVLYNGFTIIRSGKPGTVDKFEYEITFISDLKTNSISYAKAPKFESAEDAIMYIDRNCLRAPYYE